MRSLIVVGVALGGLTALYFALMIWRFVRRRARRGRKPPTFEHEMPWGRPRPPAPPPKLYSVGKEKPK